MAYNAKTNWKYDDTVTENDLNRIEQGIRDSVKRDGDTMAGDLTVRKMAADKYSTGGHTFSTYVGKFNTLVKTADQKIDLYYTGSYVGYIDVTVIGNWRGVNTLGKVTKRLSVNHDATDKIHYQLPRYEEVFGEIRKHAAISDLTWDAANNRWRIQIAFGRGDDNYTEDYYVAVEGFSTYTEAATSVMNSALGTIYTTDPAVLPSPEVSFPHGAQFKGDIDIGANIISTDAAEHAFKKQNAKAHHGFYINDTYMGMYDWKNARNVLVYHPAPNSLSLMSGGGAVTTKNNTLDNGNGGAMFKGGVGLGGSVTTKQGTADGGQAHYSLQTSAGSQRFGIGLTGVEAGSNTGSQFAIWNYTDAGAFISTALSINRKTSAVTTKNNTLDNGNGDAAFKGGVSVPGIATDKIDFSSSPTGMNELKKGNGDNANYTTHNLKLKGWHGMGMVANDDSVNGVYDFRAGRWMTKGGFAVVNAAGAEQFSINSSGDLIQRGTTMVPTRLNAGAFEIWDGREWRPVGTDLFRLTPNIQTVQTENSWARDASVDIISVSGKGILGKASVTGGGWGLESICFVVDGVESRMTSFRPDIPAHMGVFTNGHAENHTDYHSTSRDISTQGIISLEAPIRFNSSFIIRLKPRPNREIHGRVNAELITMMT